jgi:hypothetical protein
MGGMKELYMDIAERLEETVPDWNKLPEEIKEKKIIDWYSDYCDYMYEVNNDIGGE